MSLIPHNSSFIFLVTFIGRILVLLIDSSLRIKFIGRDPGKNVIYAFWHSKLFPLVYTHRNKNIVALVSEHRDGELIARIIRKMGFLVIRGSSTHGGMRAVKEIIKLSRRFPIAITPDGPTGPREEIKDGILKISQHTGLPIIPIGVGMQKKIVFGSWDRFNLPIPFSKCIIKLGKPFYVKDDINQARNKLKKTLKECNQQAEAIAWVLGR
jgi:hypothetical protein